MAATVATVAVSVACSSPGAPRRVAVEQTGPPGTTTTLPPTTEATTTTLAPVVSRPTTTSPALIPAASDATVATAVPGESGAPVAWTAGPWTAAGRPVNGTAVVFTSLLQRPGAAPLGAARMDTSRLRVALYAGTTEPAGTWSAQGAVDSSLWPALVATFNSGFQLNSSRGGYYADGREAQPLRSAAASLVIYRDGSATVGSWGRDVQLTSDVVAVRQNLELLVDGGRLSPNIATNVQATWGFMLDNVIDNWRSALGVDASGRLVYVGGPGVDPSALAGALIAAGVQRAMELDVNPAWVSFDTFSGGSNGSSSAVTGTKLLAAMNFPTNHYLSSSTRDFVAVFAR